MRVLLFCLLLISTGLLSQVYAANISVRSDRNPVNADEGLTLIFSSDDEPEKQPDFSPLNKDFEVISTSTSSNVQIVNNVVSKVLVWRLEVLPKDTGIVTVPAISFGKDASPPLRIVVNDGGSAAGGRQNDIIVELVSETASPYVQQQIIVTQRLMHAVSLRKTGATMSHPRISEGKGLVQQLGGISNKTLLRNGIKYKVSERRYAVFPQTSGKLTLGRTVFQGILDDGTQRRDFFGMSGHQVRRFSAPLAIEVREQPPKSGNTWLPANSLSINAHWEVPPGQIKTGEPVTLTLAVIADGLLAEQLPELEVSPPQGIKAYSNQPEYINNSNGDSVIATRQEKWILIATAPGEYKLPQITQEWWNLGKGKLEVAKVAPTTITVTGEVVDDPQLPLTPDATGTPQAEPGEIPGTAGESSGTDAEDLITPEAEGEIPDSTQQVATEKPAFPPIWLWLVGLISLALVGLAIWLRRRLHKTAERKMQRVQRKNRVSSLHLLEKACRNNEPQKAYDALSDWVRQELLLTPATLSQLRKEADFPLKQALDDLSMVLYSSQHNHWNGEDLWYQVKQHVKPKQVPGRPQSGLLNMYPD